MQVVEVVVEAHQQRLRQADVLCGNDEAQREGAQHEDADRDQRTDDDCLGVVLRRVLYVHDVYAHHLHTRIEEEDAAGQHKVVELREVGEESLRHVHVVVAAGRNVDDAQQDQQTRGNDRADHAAPFADFTYPSESLERDERGDPVDCQHHAEREDLVRGQRRVVHVVHAYKGDRHGAERQYGGVPDGRFDPLQPDGKESGACAVSFADPSENAALLCREHRGQLRGDHGRGNEEHDGGKQIVECRRKSVDGLCGQAAQTHYGSHVHNCECHHTQFEPGTCGSFLYIHNSMKLRIDFNR